MSLGSPFVLIILVAVPAAIVAARLISRRGPSVIAFTNLAVLETAVGPRRRPRRRLLPAALLLLALAAAATAAARPQARLPVRVDNATIVLLVDVSGSMSARDVEPTRLDAAVSAMRGFVERLPAGFKVGLVQFSDVPEVLATPTEDHTRISETLGLLVPDSGTALGAGLATAVRLTKGSLARDGVVAPPGRKLPAAIILLSDGKQNQGRIRPLQAAALARAAGIPVDTVALGTPHGVLGDRPVRAACRAGTRPDAPDRQGHERGHCDREGHEGADGLLPPHRYQHRPRHEDTRHRRVVRSRRGGAARRSCSARTPVRDPHVAMRSSSASSA